MLGWLKSLFARAATTDAAAPSRPDSDAPAMEIDLDQPFFAAGHRLWAMGYLYDNDRFDQDVRNALSQETTWEVYDHDGAKIAVAAVKLAQVPAQITTQSDPEHPDARPSVISVEPHFFASEGVPICLEHVVSSYPERPVPCEVWLEAKYPMDDSNEGPPTMLFCSDFNAMSFAYDIRVEPNGDLHGAPDRLTVRITVFVKELGEAFAAEFGDVTVDRAELEAPPEDGTAPDDAEQTTFSLSDEAFIPTGPGANHYICGVVLRAGTLESGGHWAVIRSLPGEVTLIWNPALRGGAEPGEVLRVFGHAAMALANETLT